MFEIAPPPFIAEALCAQTDPEVFYPEKGQSSATARKICLACSVRTECLLWAIETRQRHGVWGGLTPRGRDKLKWRMSRIRRNVDGLAS